MDEIEKTIKTIPVHIKRWNMVALYAPPVFLSVGTSLILSDIIDFGLLFWIGAGILSLTAFAWWLWILHTVFHLSKYLWETHNDLERALFELLEIKKDVNRSNTNDQQN